jgi:hypothetical protein
MLELRIGRTAQCASQHSRLPLRSDAGGAKGAGFQGVSAMPSARKTAAPPSANSRSAKLLISDTLTICGEVAERLKAAVC